MLSDLLASLDERTALARGLYVAILGDPARLRLVRRMQYRCATSRHCLLLDAIETPAGVVIHRPRYKYSPSQNEARSSEEGRRANTYDGENHWREHTYFLEQSALAHPWADAMRLGLTCDHVLDAPLRAPDFAADWQGGHAEMRLRRDGSRYAVR